MLAKSAGAIEYPDRISAEVYNSSNECSDYDTKLSDSETEAGNVEYSFIAITPKSSLTRSGNT